MSSNWEMDGIERAKKCHHIIQWMLGIGYWTAYEMPCSIIIYGNLSGSIFKPSRIDFEGSQTIRHLMNTVTAVVTRRKKVYVTGNGFRGPNEVSLYENIYEKSSFTC